MKFKINNKIQELDKSEIIKLECHITDTKSDKESPYLLLKTTKEDIKTVYALEFRSIYRYCKKNKIDIRCY